MELAKIIQTFIPSTEIEIIASKKDPRNYKVSFEKIKRKLKFLTKNSVSDSIQQMISEVNSGRLDPRDTEFSNMAKLTENVKVVDGYNFRERL